MGDREKTSVYEEFLIMTDNNKVHSCQSQFCFCAVRKLSYM